MKAAFRKAKARKDAGGSAARKTGKQLRDQIRRQRAARQKSAMPPPSSMGPPVARAAASAAAVPAGFFDAPAAAPAVVPAGFFDDAPASSATHPAAVPPAAPAVSEPAPPISAVPVGFFDDAVSDAQARGIDLEAKAAENMESDWKQFSAMTDELEADATAQSALVRSELELQDHFAALEQASYLSRVDRMRAALERRKRKRARFEPEVAALAGGAVAASALGARPDRASLRRRLLAFYAIHDEGKLAKVDALVEKYGAVPEKLLASLCTKYGVGAVPTVPLSAEDPLRDAGDATVDDGEEDAAQDAEDDAAPNVLDLLRARKRRKREAGAAMVRKAASVDGMAHAWRSKGGR